jgi:hypothetical protein
MRDDAETLIREKLIYETNQTVMVDPEIITAGREFEEFLLHQDPEKVLTARGRGQIEPYGTDAAVEDESATQQAADEDGSPEGKPAEVPEK